MASFTDKLVEFNPYISQLPVDDYTRVGMIKQQQYDQGVQKVQQYIDSVRGLEVAKDVHKEYIDKTLQNLQGEVGKVLSADYSKQQLQNQIGSLTSKIIADPIVQNALISTASYKKGLTDMNKAKAEGKSSVENEWKFQSQANQWLSDGDAKSGFNGQYTPYRDVRKKMLDVIKGLDKSSKLTQIPFLRNNDGSVIMDKNGRPELDQVMIESNTEGLDPETISRALQLALDESDIQQLSIEGEYHFRGLDPVGMKQVVDQNYKAKENDFNNMLASLETKKKININDNEEQSKLDRQIGAIKEGWSNISKSYTQDIQNLSQNPDGFKSQFYTRNYFDQVGKAFSSSKESFKYLDNPYQKRILEEKKFNLDYQKALHDWNMDELNYNLKLKEASDKEKESKTLAGQGLISNPIPLNIPTDDVTAPTKATWQSGIEQDEARLEASKSQALSTFFPGQSRNQAEKALMETKQAWEEGKDVAPIIAEYFNTTEKANQDLTNKKATLLKVQQEVNSLGNVIPAGTKGITMGGKLYTPGDLLSFNDKIDKILKPNVGGSPTIDQRAVANLSDRDKELFKIWNKNFSRESGEKLAKGEQIVLDRLTQLRNETSPIVKEAIKKREQIFNDKLAPISTEYQPEGYIVDSSNPQKLGAIKGVVNTLLGKAEQRGESFGASPNFDYDATVKANNDKDATYGVYKQGDKFYITISDKEGKAPQYIPVQANQINSIFNGAFNRPFDPVKKTIAMSGGISTNVRREGANSAYFIKSDFPNVTKYGVKADLERSLNGGYQVRFYIHDPETKQWIERVPKAIFYDEQDALNKINATGDLTIKELLAQ